MLYDYRKPYKNRRIEPLSQWLITQFELARQLEKDLRATPLGIARRNGKPVRLWAFNVHNIRGEIKEFVEYHETSITGNEGDEILRVMSRGRDLQRDLGLETEPWSDEEATALRNEGWENYWPVNSTWTRIFDDPRVANRVGYLDFYDYGMPNAKRIQFAYSYPPDECGGTAQKRGETDSLVEALSTIRNFIETTQHKEKHHG